MIRSIFIGLVLGLVMGAATFIFLACRLTGNLCL